MSEEYLHSIIKTENSKHKVDGFSFECNHDWVVIIWKLLKQFTKLIIKKVTIF